jgi:chromosome partitioning protein
MIFAITNIKGGVGKTTTATNLAFVFAEKNQRTLLVDLDPQAHATRCFLEETPERDISDLIMDKPSLAMRSVSSTVYTNLDIVPATARLTETAELLSARIRREERLWRALAHLEGEYRHIILDCPPSLGILTYNAVVAADLLLIPVQPGVGAVEGLSMLLDVTRELRDEDAVAYRILITMFDVRTSRTNSIFEELMEEHKRWLLTTVISKSESLNQANLAGKPILIFAPHSRGAGEYGALCNEIQRIRI